MDYIGNLYHEIHVIASLEVESITQAPWCPSTWPFHNLRLMRLTRAILICMQDDLGFHVCHVVHSCLLLRRCQKGRQCHSSHKWQHFEASGGLHFLRMLAKSATRLEEKLTWIIFPHFLAFIFLILKKRISYIPLLGNTSQIMKSYAVVLHPLGAF